MRGISSVATGKSLLLYIGSAFACVASCGGSTKVEPVRTQVYTEPGTIAPSPTGIEFPEGYKDWKVLTVAHRVDKQTLRVVLGNPVAIKAARERKTNPWPDGTVIANVVWEQIADSNWPNSITVDKFIRVEFMMKDLQSNTDNDSGWGWARWTGNELTPYGSGDDSDEECVECHAKVSDTDWVFANPVLMP